jgi:hypothetical protein
MGRHGRGLVDDIKRGYNDCAGGFIDRFNVAHKPEAGITKIIMNYRFYNRPSISWPIELLLASEEKFHSEYFVRFSCKSFRYIDCFDMKLKVWNITWKEGVGSFLNLLRWKCQTFILYFYNRRHLQLFRKLRVVQVFQRIAHEMHDFVGFRTSTRINNFINIFSCILSGFYICHSLQIE